MAEEVKRLAPKGNTLRELFLKSGNLCAFPGCGHLMMDAEGTFIGQVCHIEAADVGGERFNEEMDNEQRRAAANLMLMCNAHHTKTNDVSVYTVAKLRQMKADHERRFSRPDRAILDQLTDWTEADQATEVQNLLRMDAVLAWKNNPAELSDLCGELNEYIARLGTVPVELRRFVGKVARRAVKMENTRTTTSGMFGTKILISDLKRAFGLSETAIAELANDLDGYGIGDFDEIDTDFGLKPAVRIRDLRSGWPFWTDLASFCDKANESIEAFTDNLDFARLDG